MSPAGPTHARSARSRTAAWLVATALVAMVAAVVAAALLSPAMRSEPAKREPEATPVTRAVVERRALGDEVPTLRGTLRATTTISVSAPALTPPVARLVVTDAPADVGTVVSSGNVLIGISGRPIIALATDVPLYRPLYPDDTGEDVRQLQAALAELGLYAGEVDGVFGSLTAEAVTAMYAQVGYEAPAPEAQRVAALEQAEDQWAALAAAEDAAAEGDGAGGPSAHDRTAAWRQLTRARDDAGAWLPLDEVAHVPDGGALVTSITEMGSVLAPDQTTVAVLVGGQPVFTVRAPAGQAAVFGAGERVQVRAADGSAVVSGTVQHAATATGTATGTEGGARADADAGELVIVAPRAAEAGLADGAQVVVTPEGRVPPAPALVVPPGAVREDEGGRYALVAAADGARHGSERSARPPGPRGEGWPAASDGYTGGRPRGAARRGPGGRGRPLRPGGRGRRRAAPPRRRRRRAPERLCRAARGRRPARGRRGPARGPRRPCWDRVRSPGAGG
ncbi:peptidoglycan-binding domain-containing protein [Cellulomonas timonensis]|uniref:peptidoglycan-binding domain-containing protein n=1 Tax=Cellulomonas timonensis TaxID=1689271 RepID=UPI000832547D|nr:peptidoglycan-binding domain-containing protein [Cellulomonas timonensis]